MLERLAEKRRNREIYITSQLTMTRRDSKHRGSVPQVIIEVHDSHTWLKDKNRTKDKSNKNEKDEIKEDEK